MLLSPKIIVYYRKLLKILYQFDYLILDNFGIIFYNFCFLLFLWVGAVEAEGADFALRQSNSGYEVLYLGVFE
jgi:hypothetical protein